MKSSPKYLTEFYSLMNQSRDIRRMIVHDFFQNKSITQYADKLEDFLNALKGIESTSEKYKLYLDSDNFILADLSYEITEIEKDILFCKKGFQGVNNWHINKHKHFQAEIKEVLKFITKQKIEHFITDRDGTINNYCGRYISSIQSAYNAIWLTSFAKENTTSSTILTSAPIASPGILDVNVSPENNFILAGSKGREFIYNNKTFQLEITDNQKEKLNTLSQRIKFLTEDDRYKKFSLIGSGMQTKFGQITLARQDISKVIPENESLNLLIKINEIVQEIDPYGSYFRIEDTGMDIEVMLTVNDDDNSIKDFDKGDGINYINNTLQLGFEKNNCLICGDTHSDIPMVAKLLSKNDHVFSIFVTQNPKLIKDLKEQLDQNKLLILSNPDVLITALGIISGIIKN